MDCPKCQLQCVPTCNDGDNRWWCSRCHAGYPASQPDPKRPCDTHGISGCERCFGWCDHGARIAELAQSAKDSCDQITRLSDERDQLRARVQELAAELKEAHGAAHQHLQRYHDTLAERDAARAECQRLKADIVDVYERCQRLEAQAARMRDCAKRLADIPWSGRFEDNAAEAWEGLSRALAETNAGALWLAVVEAAREWLVGGISSRKLREAVDAWDAGGKGEKDG